MTSYPYLTANVLIHSDLTLENVAKILSKTLFAGAPFGGKNDYIYDEMPAVYITEKMSPLGLYITLQGYGGKTGYMLQITSIDNLPPAVDHDDFTLLDLSPYITSLLRDVQGITV